MIVLTHFSLDSGVIFQTETDLDTMIGLRRDLAWRTVSLLLRDLDLLMAFNAINHCIFLECLPELSLGGSVLCWCCSLSG